VSPQLQLESVELGGPGVLPEHRAALQHDIIDAVTRVMRDVVTSSARMLEGQQESPDIRSMRAALQKELRRRSCRAGGGESNPNPAMLSAIWRICFFESVLALRALGVSASTAIHFTFGAGGGSWRDGSLRESSSLRPCLIKDRGVSYVQASQDLNVHPSQLRDWVKKLSEDPQHAFPGHGQMKPRAARDRASQARSGEAEGGARHPKKG
jgi:hypothetical protein